MPAEERERGLFGGFRHGGLQEAAIVAAAPPPAAGAIDVVDIDGGGDAEVESVRQHVVKRVVFLEPRKPVTMHTVRRRSGGEAKM